MKILVVDDSRIMRNIIKNTLNLMNRHGHEYFEAADGKAAFEILLKNNA